MHNSYILAEINKLRQHAKWRDETVVAHIEAYISNEEPDLSPLPALADQLNQQKATCSTRLSAYLDYFVEESVAIEPLLVHLAGELPERDMTTLAKGDTVYWLDPGDHLGSGWYTITGILADDEYPINPDSVVLINSKEGSEAEVLPGELR